MENGYDEKFTDRLKKVIAIATSEARRYNHHSLKPEHILLGLIIEGGNSVGLTVLKELLGNNVMGLRLNLEHMIIGHEFDSTSIDRSMNDIRYLRFNPDQISPLPYDPLTAKVVEAAYDISKEWGTKHIGTEHIIYALAIGPGSSSILGNMGITPSKIAEVTKSLLGPEDSELFDVNE